MDKRFWACRASIVVGSVAACAGAAVLSTAAALGLPSGHRLACYAVVAWLVGPAVSLLGGLALPRPGAPHE